MKWTTPADLRSQIQKCWDSGEILSGLVSGTSMFPKRLRLKTPTSAEIANQFDDLRIWIADLQKTPVIRLELREINHRVFGKNIVPYEAWVDSLDGALQVIGRKRDASRFAALVAMVSQRQSPLLQWLGKRPHKALELYDDWPRLLDVVAWLQAHPQPHIYLREVSIPGIHTKFLESNRAVLAELFDIVLPAEAIDWNCGGTSQFNRRYGFREKPIRIRFRILDSTRTLLPLDVEQDLTLDAETFCRLDPSVSTVFITENETNFLAFPSVPDSMIVFGAGYGFDMLGKASWLHDRNIFYWGDIDTHGFSILSSARRQLPHIQSILMDEQTLLRHVEFLVTEDYPHPSETLPHLNSDEQALYTKLKQHAFSQNCRLEQERIDWHYACEAIFKSVGRSPGVVLQLPGRTI